MRGKFDLRFLILCAYLSQEIGALPKEIIGKIPDLDVIKKGTIESSEALSDEVEIKNVPYLVNIWESDERRCAGSLLSATVVLTASGCIPDNILEDHHYTIRSGSSSMDDKGKRHLVVRIIKQYEDKKDAKNRSSLVLLEIDPPVDLVRLPNRPISLHPIAQIANNTVAKFTGWGCMHRLKPIDNKNEDEYFEYLHSENVVIIDRPSCLKNYLDEDVHVVSKTSICTNISSEDIGKCNGDWGAPLILNEKLIAVQTTSPYTEFPPHQLVYINLAERENYQWVIENQKKIEEERGSKESSHLRVHQKREVLNDKVNIEDVPYLVNIWEMERRVCAGIILSSNVVITAAGCISDTELEQVRNATVISGSSNMEDKGKHHVVVKVIKHKKETKISYPGFLALLEINPPIDLVQSPNRPISLHPIAQIANNTVAKFTGWGCIHRTKRRITNEFGVSEYLNSENALIIDRQTCLKNFSGEDVHVVSNTSICTKVSYIDLGKCNGDVGAPLIINEQLVAVQTWPPVTEAAPHEFVYINLAERENYEWVIKKQRMLEESVAKKLQ